VAFPGIPLPEEVVRNIAQNVIDKLDATDMEIVDYAIGQLSDGERSSLRTAFRNRPGKARLGYALEAAEDWQITVVLGATTAPYRSIGNVVGPEEEDEVFRGTLTASVSNERGALLPLASLPPAEIGDGGRVRLDEEVAVWGRAADGVRLPYRGVQGTVAAVHPAGSSASFHTLSERIGWGELVQVRCDILSSDAWFNMILATMTKAGILANHAEFERAGCTLTELTETDLAPRPELWPADLLHRTIMVQVQRDFTVPEDLRVILDIQTEVIPTPLVAETPQ